MPMTLYTTTALYVHICFDMDFLYVVIEASESSHLAMLEEAKAILTIFQGWLTTRTVFSSTNLPFLPTEALVKESLSELAR